MISLAAIVVSPLVTRAQPAGNDATVNFVFKPCSMALAHRFVGGALEYRVWSNDYSAPEVLNNAVWNSRDSELVETRLHVAPGVYSYRVLGVHRKGSEIDVECSYYWYLALLPGTTRSISETMMNGLVDPIPTLMIYGAVARETKVSVVRYDDRLECGASTSGASARAISLDMEPGAYYANDNSLTAQKNNTNIVFGLQLRKPDLGMRIIRIVADYPQEVVGVAPTFVHLDLTESQILDVFKARPGVLLCLDR
jgi:hypothetical protein